MQHWNIHCVASKCNKTALLCLIDEAPDIQYNKGGLHTLPCFPLGLKTAKGTVFSHAWLRAAWKNYICPFVHKPSSGFSPSLTNYYMSPCIHGPSVFENLPPGPSPHFPHPLLLPSSWLVINMDFPPENSKMWRKKKGLRSPSSSTLVVAHGFSASINSIS